MIETRSGRQEGPSEQELKEKLLDQLAETLELVAEGQAEQSDLQSCLGHFDKEDLLEVDAERALEHFHEKHHVLIAEENDIRTPEHRHPTRKYFRRLAAIVAAAAFFSTMYIAGASDEGIAKMIGRWTSETFQFGGVSGEPPELAGGNQPVAEGAYDSIEAALDECEISQSAFPKWIPERFHLEKISVRQGGSRFCAVRSRYSSTDKAENCIIDIMRFYQIRDARSCVFEKDDTSVIEYEQNGIIHYFLKNPAGDAAVWIDGNLMCSITGDLTTEEFKSIIDSIYKE